MRVAVVLLATAVLSVGCRTTMPAAQYNVLHSEHLSVEEQQERILERIEAINSEIIALAPKMNAFLGAQRRNATRRIAALQAEQAALKSRYDILSERERKKKLEQLRDDRKWLVNFQEERDRLRERIRVLEAELEATK